MPWKSTYRKTNGYIDFIGSMYSTTDVPFIGKYLTPWGGDLINVTAYGACITVL